ncbi:Protein GLY-16 [Aphelenchoides avenae]|nr:Protein GLY-16 [Aphelenchus avenae]KAH7712889.1 Protein GLY-16 [Aphelenchus avenae]
MLVYKNAVQVYFMLSAVYHPQNAYCVAVDGNTTSEFKRRIGLLAECFPNVYVVGVGDVSWGGYEVVQGVLSCVKLLSDLRHPWKYYQYLSGFDLPLKTNLEVVRILKQLNGTANVEVSLAERKHLPRLTLAVPNS